MFSWSFSKTKDKPQPPEDPEQLKKRLEIEAQFSRDRAKFESNFVPLQKTTSDPKCSTTTFDRQQGESLEELAAKAKAAEKGRLETAERAEEENRIALRKAELDKEQKLELIRQRKRQTMDKLDEMERQHVVKTEDQKKEIERDWEDHRDKVVSEVLTKIEETVHGVNLNDLRAQNSPAPQSSPPDPQVTIEETMELD